MSKERWFDRNGVELHESDIIVDVASGQAEFVYACHPEGCPDNERLGVNASNEAWLKNHPDHTREVYPFNNFSYTVVNGQRWLDDYEKVV